MSQYKFTVTAARGMLPILQKELAEMGIKQTKLEQGNIRFTGSLEQAYRVCLWSRVAIRVLLPIAHFTAESTDQLYEGIKAIDWQQHLDAEDSTLAVDFNSFRSKIKHSQYGAQRVKDGVVDYFRELTGMRPSVDLYQPDLRINVYLKHNQATVSIDLSGESLHKRGYRIENTAAPLKEHLAAAILYTADWPKLAQQGWHLLDPMCGSGTFLIEAAMMAADIAPGSHRDYFGFLYWKQHDKQSWTQLKAEAERRRHSGLARLPQIFGGDSDPKAVAAAKANSAEIGLSDTIHIKNCRLLDWPSYAKDMGNTGLIVCNPPYGERIGRDDDLPQLYESLGSVVSQSFPGWRTSLITDNTDLAKLTGLTLFDSMPFDNGPIACTVLHYRSPRRLTPNINIADETATETLEVSEIDFSDENISPQAEMFANRFKKNLKHRQKWAKKQDLECYRIYDADLPDYAVAIDCYGDYIHVQEYAPPKQIDAEKALQRLNDVMHLLPSILGLPRSHIVLKLRQRQRGKQQYQTQAALKQRIQVHEQGHQFWVNLSDYLDTGLFLDHRVVRKMIEQQASGKRFLNLFAYTGTASVYAAAGQAQSTTTVDMSNTYLAWAKDNMSLNGFDGEQHQFVRGNCLEWLDEAQKSNQKYDLIFLDPPTFSNSSRMEGVFDIQRDYIELLNKTLNLLSAKGTLLFSTNRRDFSFDEKHFTGVEIENISHKTRSVDFERNTKIHHCWRLEKTN
jgi:23S rRNA (guanine2445-N2)-methyltransferase / 23S rRNA (guanine2069-N7)-methyltransferase